MQHFRSDDPLIDAMLVRSVVRIHRDVIGELAMGRDPEAAACRDAVIGLPGVEAVDRMIVLSQVAQHRMNGMGIGWVDAGLLASCLASSGTMAIYTRDRAMARVATAVGVPVIDAFSG